MKIETITYMNENITGIRKYTYDKNNQLLGYTDYDSDNKPTAKTVIYRFKTEEEANKFAVLQEEGAMSFENGVYIVEVSNDL